MIKLIESTEELNSFMDELINCRISMFKEEPFNNHNITYDECREWFINTFNNGLIFIALSDFRIIGFRTIIKSVEFRDFDKFDMDMNSSYLSCLWIHKDYRGKGLGEELMTYSLDKTSEITGSNKFYVRTRSDTPEISNLLIKVGFKVFLSYETLINNEKITLQMWIK